MTLRIERTLIGRVTILRLIGRIRSENLAELKLQISAQKKATTLDLEGVTLVDLEVVRFLAACEEVGIKIVGCPPYIQEWIRREQGGK